MANLLIYSSHCKQLFSLFWCISCMATPEITSSSKNSNNTARVYRLSFRFLWLWSELIMFMDILAQQRGKVWVNTLSKNKILSKHKVKHKNKIKHKVKCGEQTYSVPAAKRGKKVIVGENHVLAVADHDFTKSSIISFVDLVVSGIPEYITT